MVSNFLKYHRFSILLALTAIAFYISFAYNLDRADFIKLIGLYFGLFFISFRLIQLEKNSFWFLAGVALFYRLIFLFALPNLSQDYYRFIWDGKLILEGINPYLSVPNEFLTSLEITKTGFGQLNQELTTGMGSLSSGNYTSYPPVNQFLFAFSALLGGKSILGSVVVMRLLIILADVGVFYFGRKLLKNVGLPQHQIFWYILNPLIIIELTGNLHFEGVMIFFLVWALYLLYQKKYLWSAMVMGISVSVKLIPLMFLPILYNYFRKNKDLNLSKLLLYYSTVVITVVLSFLPFLSWELISNFSTSITLWFQKFEFNASIYYVIRKIGFKLKGYNIIESVGKILPILVFIIISVLAFFRKNNNTEKLITTMLFGITAYLFLATTVHPWYLVTPLLLSVFTKFKYMILWSLLVILSYFAYSNPDFQENYWLLAIEYIAVSGYLLFEVLQKNNSRLS